MEEGAQLELGNFVLEEGGRGRRLRCKNKMNKKKQLRAGLASGSRGRAGDRAALPPGDVARPGAPRVLVHRVQLVQSLDRLRARALAVAVIEGPSPPGQKKKRKKPASSRPSQRIQRESPNRGSAPFWRRRLAWCSARPRRQGSARSVARSPPRTRSCCRRH